MKMRRQLGEVVEVLDARLRMGHDDLRILLEHRRDLDHRDALLDRDRIALMVPPM